MGRPMSIDEQEEHKACVVAVRTALLGLRLTRLKAENIRVAMARLEDWLDDNATRWTTGGTDDGTS